MANGQSVLLFGLARRAYQEPAARHDLGRMDVECPECGALHWSDERLSTSTLQTPKFGICCDSGQVKLPLLPLPPPTLHHLLTANTDQAKDFRENIWKYNRAFAFTSMCAQEDHNVNRGRGPPVFRILGELYHRGGGLDAARGQHPTYAQLYIYDPQAALDRRRSMNEDLNPETLRSLQAMIIEKNVYVDLFRHAYEIMDDQRAEGVQDPSLRLRSVPVVQEVAVHPRRGNLPTADEVAVIICDSNGEDPGPRDVVLHLRGGGLWRINDLHPSYSPLYYVLLFPHGEPGWCQDLRLYEPNRAQPRRLSQSRFVAFRLQVRRNEFSTILRSKRLLQRYLVDMYAAIDQNRLRFLRNNQSSLRAALYSGLQDAMSATDEEVDLNQLGQKVILPSSYIGGPRHMQQRYQDSMAIARHHRRCDIFITMTCNPQWKEIQDELLPGQSAYDRPDLVARVFQMKKKALLDYIHKHGIFGSSVAYVYTVEFQKRGLPHIHLLIFLDHGWSLASTEAIDSCISAEWPDPLSQPLLFETVSRCMVHGPCGPANPRAPCMENGRCTKGYPRPFSEVTSFDEYGFPQYKTRDDGRQFKVGDHWLDNRWIVPHCGILSALFNCHINVESVASAGSFKYLFKYIQKGCDLAGVEISENDEITRYLSGRYISASEAAHRIFHFDMHDQVPNVVRLQVHLPGQHMVVFDPDDDPETVLQRAQSERTTLTAWFAANADAGPLGHLARQHTYQEFPQHFVWKEQAKRWEVRKQGFAIGRMYFVGPTGGERFYLRLLLTVVKGAVSFEDLKTFQSVCHPTFHAACLARGLLEDDREWRDCLLEACQMQVGSRLRRLFATLLLFCSPSQPDILWAEFWRQICDDIPLNLRRRGFQHPTDEIIQDFGLWELDQLLRESGHELKEWPSMPQPSRNWAAHRTNTLISEQLDYDQQRERELLQQRLPLLNEAQSAAFTSIIASIRENQPKIFFISGPGGTGKTFLYRVICNQLRGDGEIVLCVASSGISALLLPGGRTSHSTFQIPIDIHEDSLCNFSKTSNRADLMRAARAIIWDEVGAQHRHCVEAVDRTLRDVRNDERPFGGLTVILGGDFQQTLPVVRRGTREEIVEATICKSALWDAVEVHYLEENMRVRDDPNAADFARWLLDIGHGRNLDSEGKISIPNSMCVSSYEDLVDFIYEDIDTSPPPPPDYFLNRMILAPRNIDVADTNQKILDRMHGEEAVFYSVDKIIDDEGAPDHGAQSIPSEFLRSLDATNFPPGELHLKVGCPIILLRNISSASGLCNGTRLVIKRMSLRVLEVQIIGGDHDGQVSLIPRISLIPQDSQAELPFRMRRRQFPVRLAFSLTINKAQGQSVRKVGLDLRAPVFSHGQLYVALSRATHRQNIRVLTPSDGHCNVANVVYSEVLLHD